MSPTKPRHGRLEYRFARVLGNFVDEHALGEVHVGEVGVYTRRDPDTVRGADVLFISHERLSQTTLDDFFDVAPELIVEILSPTDRRGEVEKKLREYFAIGVAAVLIVDPDKRTVSVYTSAAEFRELTVDDMLTVPEALRGFSTPIADLMDQ